MIRQVLSEKASARMRVAKNDLAKARELGAKYAKADWQIFGEALVLWEVANATK
jgi:hypothetical protein